MLYTSTNTRLLSAEQREAIRQELLSELDDWRASNERLLKLSPKSSLDGVLSAFTDRNWYEALYHNAVLLLYRPSTAFPHQSLQSSVANEDNLKAMWDASRATIHNYKHVLGARKLNYSWICLYSIFIAGLSNVYSVGRCAQRRATDRTSFLPPVVDVVDDVRECSNILTAICERWDDARSSCEIFSRLSNGAIRELLKAQASQDDAPNTTQTAPAVIGQPLMSADPGYGTQMPEWSGAGSHSRRPGTAGGLDPMANTVPPQSDNIHDFQQLFQDVQTSFYDHGFDGSNEVFFGFDKDWFDQAC